MKNANFIPDSCIWRDYFRKNRFEDEDNLEALISEDKVYTCGLIIAELIAGSKIPKRG